MTGQDVEDIAERVLSLLHEQVFSVSPPIRQGNAGQVIGATYNKVGDIQATLRKIMDGYLVPLATVLVKMQESIDDISGRLIVVEQGMLNIQQDGQTHELLKQVAALRSQLATLTLVAVSQQEAIGDAIEVGGII